MAQEKVFMELCDEISVKFNPDGHICWADHTIRPNDKCDVAFTGPNVREYTKEVNGEEVFDEAAFDTAVEEFFTEMRQIESFIKDKEYAYEVELVKFEADKDCPYTEATINFTIEL